MKFSASRFVRKQIKKLHPNKRLKDVCLNSSGPILKIAHENLKLDYFLKVSDYVASKATCRVRAAFEKEMTRI